MTKTRIAKNNEGILEKLDAEEKRIRKVLSDDSVDFAELQSEWQERDSPAERNIREVEWDQYSGLQNELSEVVDAKQRLANGTFGICEDCGDEISPKRLSAVMTARKCIACQEKMEKETGIANRHASL